MGVKTGSLASPNLCFSSTTRLFPFASSLDIRPPSNPPSECPEMLTCDTSQATIHPFRLPSDRFCSLLSAHSAASPLTRHSADFSPPTLRPSTYASSSLRPPTSAYFCTSVITTVPRESCLITYFYMSAPNHARCAPYNSPCSSRSLGCRWRRCRSRASARPSGPIFRRIQSSCTWLGRSCH